MSAAWANGADFASGLVAGFQGGIPACGWATVGFASGVVLASIGYGVNQFFESFGPGTIGDGEFGSEAKSIGIDQGNLKSASYSTDEVLPEDRDPTGSFTNGGDHDVYALGEKSSNTYRVRPGETYPYSIDGFSDSRVFPNRVFKVPDYHDVLYMGRNPFTRQPFVLMAGKPLGPDGIFRYFAEAAADFKGGYGLRTADSFSPLGKWEALFDRARPVNGI